MGKLKPEAIIGALIVLIMIYFQTSCGNAEIYTEPPIPGIPPMIEPVFGDWPNCGIGLGQPPVAHPCRRNPPTAGALEAIE